MVSLESLDFVLGFNVTKRTNPPADEAAGFEKEIASGAGLLDYDLATGAAAAGCGELLAGA